MAVILIPHYFGDSGGRFCLRCFLNYCALQLPKGVRELPNGVAQGLFFLRSDVPAAVLPARHRRGLIDACVPFPLQGMSSIQWRSTNAVATDPFCSLGKIAG